MNLSNLRMFILDKLTEMEEKSPKDFRLVSLKLPVHKSSYKIDYRARLLLENGGEDVVPCDIQGDGNCLFRAISMSMYGVETFHEELRFRLIY